MAALTDHPAPIFVFVFNIVVIENLSVIRSFAYESASLSLGSDRVPPFDPVRNVNIVDVLFYDVISAEPIEIVPVAHLILHLCLTRFASPNPHAGTIPVDSRHRNVPYHSILQVLNPPPVTNLIVALQPNDYI
jgi:hypothetical protein